MVLELNGGRIEAYSSSHIDAYRALNNPKFILLDEADFFRKPNRKTLGSLVNVTFKLDPYIVFSTPNAPDN